MFYLPCTEAVWIKSDSDQKVQTFTKGAHLWDLETTNATKGRGEKVCFFVLFCFLEAVKVNYFLVNQSI